MEFPGSGNGKEVKGKEMNGEIRTKSPLLSGSSGAEAVGKEKLEDSRNIPRVGVPRGVSWIGRKNIS